MKDHQRRKLMLAASLLAVGLVQGCATKIKASSTDNPPPEQAFSTYGRIHVLHARFADGYTGDPAALAKIDENLQKGVVPMLEKWNRRPENGRTLTAEPVVEEVVFKHGAKRAILGPMVGASGVLMRMTIRDNTGRLVATPEFFQRAGAMSGGFTLGAADNMMLTRVGERAAEYIVNNFENAVGGPTGADAKAVAKR